MTLKRLVLRIEAALARNNPDWLRLIAAEVAQLETTK